MPHPEVYLGDGLYASFDGGMIALRAPRHDGDHVVYLEPEVLANFMAFVSNLRALTVESARDDASS
jgi:hypothetical protein